MGVLGVLNNVVRKRLKASSLVETLVATVILVVLFGIASLTLNTLFGNSIKNNTDAIHNQLHYLEYQYKNGQLKTPYYGTFNDWEIQVMTVKGLQESYVGVEASSLHSNKTIHQIWTYAVE